VAPPEFSVIRLDSSSAAETAALHAECLPDDVLPALGRPFLVRYYQYVLRSATQCVLGAVCNRELVGFCQVSRTPLSIRDVLRNHPASIIDVFRLALFNPKLFVAGVIMATTRPSSVSSLAEISFIAVRAKSRGLGIATSLVSEANKLAYSVGMRQLMTKTSNEVARKLYEDKFSAEIMTSHVVMGTRYWYLSWQTGTPSQHSRC